MAKTPTKAQMKVIKAPVDHPIAVIACPGSGKTFTIIQRVKLLLEIGFSPKELLLMSFSRAVANELIQRLQDECIYSPSMTVKTVHSLGMMIISDFHRSMGLPKPEFITEKKKMAILRSFADTEDNYEENYLISELSKFLAGVDFDKALEATFVNYRSYVRANHFIDFNSMISMPIELFNEHPIFKEKWQRRYKYCILDEAQDISTTQFELVQCIFGETGNLTIVGDDDQTIYEWRQADPRILVDIKTNLPNSEVYILNKCHRCPQNIVKTMQAVIKKNKKRFPKTLKSGIVSENPDEPIKVYEFDGAEEEADFVVDEIEKIPKGSSIAVLYRKNSDESTIKRKLVAARIPIIRNKSVELSTKGIEKVLAFMADFVQSDETIVDGKEIRTMKDLVLLAVEKTKATGKGIQVLKQYSDGFTIKDYDQFVEELKLVESVQSGSGRVHLSTIHQAKGLEWDYVFIIGANRLMRSKSEEERRVFYVGLSRAHKQLVISFNNPGRPIQFLKDVPEKMLEFVKKDDKSNVEARPKTKEKVAVKANEGFKFVGKIFKILSF